MLMEEAVQTIPAFSESDHITEIRINFPEVDLVFEFVPPDGHIAQRFTMLSNELPTMAVAHFYDWLGIDLAVKSELEKCLRGIVTEHFERDEYAEA